MISGVMACKFLFAPQPMDGESHTAAWRDDLFVLLRCDSFSSAVRQLAKTEVVLVMSAVDRLPVGDVVKKGYLLYCACCFRRSFRRSAPMLTSDCFLVNS
ncbi:hypothetical protein C5D35_01215 [Rathayibacter toxicus]|nr:hypothetical protein C5D35_01215 [Rathayibacter toxicus]